MSQNFDLSNYETVKTRKKRFFGDYPDGRILPELIENTGAHSVIKATLYKNRQDQLEGLALSTGYAQEYKGQGGFANKTSWLENGEESAIGRALDNAGYSGNDKCSREEIIQAKGNNKALAEHEALYMQITNEIKSRTDNFKDREKLAAIQKENNLKSSDEVRKLSLEEKRSLLDKLKGKVKTEGADEFEEDFPIPEEEKIIGDLYRIQNGKYRGEQFKDMAREDMIEYAELLEKRGLSKEWEKNLHHAMTHYLTEWDTLRGAMTDE